MQATSVTGETPYSATAKTLHWIIAVMVIVLIPVGFIMGDLPEGPLQDNIFNAHESFGLLLFVLMIVRFARRLSGTPAPAQSLSPMERKLSTLVHYSFYALLFAMPVIGYFGVSAYGEGPSFFGLKLPALLAKDEKFADKIFWVHWAGGVLISALFVLHVGGAAMHAWVKRDGVMQRMLPNRAS